MIPKRAFRKKSLKLHTNPDECVPTQQTNMGNDYLSSSSYKNRYSADLFSHLKYHQQGPLEFVKSLNTELGKINSHTKKALSQIQDSDQEKQNQNDHGLSICRYNIKIQKPLIDRSQIEVNKRIIQKDIERLTSVLDKQRDDYNTLEYIKMLQNIIGAQCQVLKKSKGTEKTFQSICNTTRD